MGPMTYYRKNLALAHHRGFGFHAELCAPGILRLLEPILARDGLVLEVGCGSGLLTRRLVDAGHRVVATDASPAMLELARQHVPDAASIELLALPDDPLPDADAIVGVGHVLSYLPAQDDVERGLRAVASALRPGGVVALDICDLEWGRSRRGAPAAGWVGDDWALVTTFSSPAPDRFVREMAAFVRQPDGSWHRDDERHENVLVDTGRIPGLLAASGVHAEIRNSFGEETLPVGLHVVVGGR